MTNLIKPKKKASSVRHTRAIALDRSKRPVAAPPAEHIEQLLNELVQPAMFNTVALYQKLGLRVRTLTLPVMVAFVLSVIWRQLGSVAQAVRMLNETGMLWQPPVKVSQQAVNDRLRELKASLFEAVFEEALPLMQQRYAARTRPVPPPMQTALRHFSRLVAFDGSTLDAVVKKCGLLRECEGTVLAGKMMAVLDLASRLPVKIWYGEDSAAHDQSWWEALVGELEAGSLSLFDLGFVNYERYRELSETGRYFVSRVKSNMAYQKLDQLTNGVGVREWLIQIGQMGDGTGQILRLVEVQHEGKWYSYLTNVLERGRLVASEIAYLYRQRWRIEDAFRLVKRLLGLAYFVGSSINAIEVQVWLSWLLYGVLIDLTDGVAQELDKPFGAISTEMVYRGAILLC